ncbi:MAG: DUF4058 family protein [Planctomycetes bacterium]|nr:DUF4058 family protein [Planctomycetota bacterium]
MPMHDWSHVTAGTYHNFHLQWIASIAKQLNSGILPAGCFAMAEQVIGGPEPDVVTLMLDDTDSTESGGTRVLAEPATQPSTSVVMKAEMERYVQKANRIVVRHSAGAVLAIIELISPGNKSSIYAMRTMVNKMVELFCEGINLLVVDPFPPGPRDPNGIHALIWEQITDEPFRLSAELPLTIASYQATPTKTAWIELISVGSMLPTMPLFLKGAYYVNVPLEVSYQETWNAMPIEVKRIIDRSSL